MKAFSKRTKCKQVVLENLYTLQINSLDIVNKPCWWVMEPYCFCLGQCAGTTQKALFFVTCSCGRIEDVRNGTVCCNVNSQITSRSLNKNRLTCSMFAIWAPRGLPRTSRNVLERPTIYRTVSQQPKSNNACYAHAVQIQHAVLVTNVTE